MIPHCVFASEVLERLKPIRFFIHLQNLKRIDYSYDLAVLFLFDESGNATDLEVKPVNLVSICVKSLGRHSEDRL